MTNELYYRAKRLQSSINEIEAKTDTLVHEMYSPCELSVVSRASGLEKEIERLKSPFVLRSDSLELKQVKLRDRKFLYKIILPIIMLVTFFLLIIWL